MKHEVKTRVGGVQDHQGPRRHHRLENLVKSDEYGCGKIVDDDVPTEDELEGGNAGVRRHELSSLSCSG